jgi:hypothetical protein
MQALSTRSGKKYTACKWFGNIEHFICTVIGGRAYVRDLSAIKVVAADLCLPTCVFCLLKPDIWNLTSGSLPARR